MQEYLQDQKQVLEDQKSSIQGLQSKDIASRVEQFGKNKLAEGKKTSLVVRFLQELMDPMILVLIAAAAVSGITAALSGESFADVFIILFVVVLNGVLGVAQESKAEKAIEALQKIAAATSKVLRDGQPMVIPSEELVPGDVVLLEAGDAVPADGRLLESASLKIEEAALTGESLPVEKQVEALEVPEGKDVPLGDRKNMVYMGSSVVYGRGRAVIVATGMNTEMGKIADALTKAEKNETPLQMRLTQLSKILSILVLGICVIIFATNVIRHYPNISGQVLLDTFMVAVSLAVAAIPEGLAAVVTIVLSIGVTNMAKRGAVIRKLTAVETLGCAQIICSDKTGTLTQNKMTVVEHVGEAEQLLGRTMALASDARLNDQREAVGEPTECALVMYADKIGQAPDQLVTDWPRMGEAPFDSVRKMMSTVNEGKDGQIVQYTKGAPDEVLKKCTSWCDEDGKEWPLTEEKRKEILAANQNMADRALRVLAGAVRYWDQMPEKQSPEYLEQKLCFVGMVGMMDPVRPEVLGAMDKCRKAGIRPIMITGDHRDTAAAIAMKLGIISSKDQAITGAELDQMSDEELEKNIQNISVYARVQPEHKVRIVNTWKKLGKITAMTGDGVNDAPSIKSADIGVGMGITGTDVTKNVADMVLTDDNFATIVSAVEEGRRIYDNIRKSIQFLIGSNFSEVFAVFTATLMGFTVLKPVHLLWINLITDCFPALALGMENAEPDVMEHAPRDSKEGIFAGGMGFDVVYQGLIIAALTIIAYFTGHYMESGVWEIAPSSPDGMTMAFLTLSMTEIFHSFNMRSRRKSVFGLKNHNKVLWGAMAASLVCTLAVVYIPFLSNAFGFEHISLVEYGVSIALAILVIPIVELVKLIQRKRERKA